MKYKKEKCKYCENEISNTVLKRHEETCYLNPKVSKYCLNCGELCLPNNGYTYHKKHKGTCSVSCSNSYFRSGPSNPNWKEDNYTTTCFYHHGKKCLKCGEEKIVGVHHVNGIHTDNRPENLVPLCPTHHQYIHSRYKYEVQPIVDKYLHDWLMKNRV